MSSTSERESARSEPRFVESIKGKIALANLMSVLVLLVVAAFATLQFRQLGKLLGSMSDGAEVMMRLSHAYDEREDLLSSFRKGYGEGGGANTAARARFVAITEDIERHTRAAHEKLLSGNSDALLAKARTALRTLVERARNLDRLSSEERDVAAIEIEEELSDAIGNLAAAKLDSSRTMERRLATVRIELVKPVRLFWLAAAVGCLLAVGISFFLRARVSRPIEKLSQAVAALARGEPNPVSVAANDELGRLGLAFNGMAETITERTRSLKLVLDNVGDGLVTCDLAGEIVGEPSRNAVAWFGPAEPGTRLADYLSSHDERLREWLFLGFEQLVSEVLSFEAAAEQIPKEVRRGDRTFAVEFRPVSIGDRLARVLVVVTDVTERRELAHKEREGRDVYHLASVALREPETFTDFVADTEKRLARVAEGTDVLLELHTVKGNAGVMGCDYFSSSVHAAESRAVEGALGQDDVKNLTRRWRELVDGSEAAVGRSATSALMIPRGEYERLCKRLSSLGDRESEMLAVSWSMQRMDSIFQRLSRTAEQYATRVGKRVRVESEGGELAVPRGPLDELWNNLVHLVKNCVAHGVEREEERRARGKPAQGRVSLRAATRGKELTVSVRDDGAGIAWEALGAGALDDAGRLDALARGGSTTREVTEYSGRGVGLSAVRKVVESLGGKVVVRSERGGGTEVVATVPSDGVFRVSGFDPIVPRLSPVSP
ncbi:MAG TPA: ATP-binding protein [Polyangiaceae bacterium]